MGIHSPEERKPFFSIITASLDNEKTIEKTMHSIKNQTFRSFEHIIIDGGSTDNTLEIIKKHQKDYPLFYLSEKDAGIADACNKGIRIANGKFIIIIHADDCLTTDTVIEQVYEDIRNGSFLIYSYPVYVEGKCGERKKYYAKPYKWMHRFKTFFPHQGCFVRSDVFQSVGFFNTSLKIAFDFDFFIRCFKQRISYQIFRRPFVAVMTEGGISTDSQMLKKRVREEFRVQRSNGDSPVYRLIYSCYQRIYYFYKVQIKNGAGRLLKTTGSDV